MRLGYLLQLKEAGSRRASRRPARRQLRLEHLEPRRLLTAIIKGPYLQQPTPSSMVVMWETDVAEASRVDYDGSYVEDPTPVTIHEVPITGLAADTTYTYTVTSGDATSPASTFSTAPAVERSFRFVAYGDTRSQPAEHAAVIQGIINTPGGPPELVLHSGDLVANGRNYSEWEPQFFTPAHDLMVDTPMIPILGNHEYGGTGQLWFLDFFSLPNNEEWFGFTYSNVRFVGLNTNVSYSPGSSQYNWLVSELQSAEFTGADWQVVYFHHPPYTATSGHSDDTNVQQYLVPLFEQNGVDIVFNGHSHVYERYYHNGIYYIVTGGGGAPLHSLVTDNKEPIREFGESTYHHCVIDVDVAAGTMTLSARYNSGVQFDTITLARTEPPVAVDDGPVTTDEDTPVVIDVVANDYDPDGWIDPTTVTITTPPSYAGATATPNGDGTVTYDPTGSAALQALKPGESVTDTFGYKVKDNLGAISNEATVTVNIDGVNDAPVANDDAATTELETAVVIDVLANDDDVDGDTLTVDSVTQGTHGTVVINPDQTVTYTPEAGFLGEDTFTYKPHDGTVAGNSATVTVTVTEPIIATDDFESGNFAGGSGWIESAWTTAGSLAVTGSASPHSGAYHVLLRKADAYMERPADLSAQSGARLDFWAKVDAFEGADQALVKVSPDGNNWTIVHTFTAADSDDTYRLYEIDLSGFTLSSQFFVAFDAQMDMPNDYWYVDDVQLLGTPGGENQPPVANDDAYNTPVDTQLVVPAPGVLENDTDPNPGDTLTVSNVDTTGTVGTVDWSPDGSFTYTPQTGFTGTDTFSYTANDGQVDSNWATVTITVGVVPQTFDSVDTPKPIADAHPKYPRQTLSELPIESTGIVIANLDVGLSIDHASPTDLRGYLVSPLGTRVTLFENVASIPTTFTSVGFVGESMDGIWTLELWDDVKGGTGTLNSWSLTVTPEGGGESRSSDTAAMDAALGAIALGVDRTASDSGDDDARAAAADLVLAYLDGVFL